MERARALKAAGYDVIDLAGGEPDMPPAAASRNAAINRLQRGELGYGPVTGLLELRNQIARHVSERHGIKVDATNILVGNGAKQVIFEALFAATSPEDEIIIPAPYWVSYPAMAALAGGSAKIASTTAETGFKLTPTLLRETLTPRSRWLVLNSPVNPTGAVYTRSELEALARVISDHPRCLVLSDDIYEDILYDGVNHATMASLGDEFFERSVTCSGFSKGHAMTGLRVGYASGPRWLIEPMTRIQSHMTSGGCVVGQAAAAAALLDAPEFPSECRDTYARRREAGGRILVGCKKLAVTIPDGAFYFWIGISPLLGSMSPGGQLMTCSTAVSGAALSEAMIALMPGSAFGTDGYLRMSFAAADDVVEAGCRRLAQFADGCRRATGATGFTCESASSSSRNDRREGY
jgi:aspartate aminotransferase